jgi:DNA invertase Pin-like site-specific DNA recombinase
MFLRIFPK